MRFHLQPGKAYDAGQQDHKNYQAAEVGLQKQGKPNHQTKNAPNGYHVAADLPEDVYHQCKYYQQGSCGSKIIIDGRNFQLFQKIKAYIEEDDGHHIGKGAFFPGIKVYGTDNPSPQHKKNKNSREEEGRKENQPENGEPCLWRKNQGKINRQTEQQCKSISWDKQGVKYCRYNLGNAFFHY